jgi:outer membrane protein
MRIPFRHISLIAAPVLAVILLSCDGRAQTAPPSTALPLPSPLTLDDAVHIALNLQPQQAIAQTQVTEASAAVQDARAGYLPTVTPTYQYTDVHIRNFGVAPIIFEGITLPTTATSTDRGATGTIDITANVLDSGQREVKNAEARRQVDSAGQTVRSTRQQVVYNVTQAFYEVLRAQDLKKVDDLQVLRAHQVLDQTQAQVDAGLAPKINVSQAKSDLANAQVNQLEAQVTIATDVATLKNVMGIETESPIDVAPLSRGDQLPTAPNAAANQSVDAYLPIAFANRPDYLGQQVAVESADLAVKSAQIGAGVAVAGSATALYTPVNDTGPKSDEYEVQASASYPLFDGGVGRSQIRTAKAERDAAVDQLDIVRQQVRLDVEQAAVERGESLDAIQLANLAVQAAQDNYDSEVDSHKEGIATTVDVTTAEVTFTQAEDQYVTAIYDFYEADARLGKALGVNDTGLTAK